MTSLFIGCDYACRGRIRSRHFDVNRLSQTFPGQPVWQCRSQLELGEHGLNLSHVHCILTPLLWTDHICNFWFSCWQQELGQCKLQNLKPSHFCPNLLIIRIWWTQIIQPVISFCRSNKNWQQSIFLQVIFVLYFCLRQLIGYQICWQFRQIENKVSTPLCHNCWWFWFPTNYVFV